MGWLIRASLDCGFLLERASLFSVRLTSVFVSSIIGVFSTVIMFSLSIKMMINIVMLINGATFHFFLSSLRDF